MENKIEQVMNDINKSIYDLINHYNCPECELRVSMPKYLELLLIQNYNDKIQNTPKTEKSSPTFIFGIKIIENYQNNIVVFHENGTLHNDNFYKIIELI